MVVLLASCVGVGGALAAIGLIETIKFGFFATIFFPMFTRIRRENVLDLFVRGQIYEYIRKHPGAHYNEIKSEMQLNNGTLAYHIKTLMLQGFVKASRDGMYKRFYMTDINPKVGEGRRFSKLQTSIIAIIKKKPGLCQSDIARILDIPFSVVNYNIKLLVRQKAIRIEDAGRKQHCYPVIEVTPVDTPS
jgi:predicted transcriptional regulator